MASSAVATPGPAHAPLERRALCARLNKPAAVPALRCLRPLRSEWLRRRRIRTMATILGPGRGIRLRPRAAAAVGGERAPGGVDSKKLTLVRFRTRRKLAPLEFLQISGEPDALGRWDREAAPRMIPYGEDVWELDLMLGAGSTVEFACAMGGPDGRQGIGEEARSVNIPACCDRVDVEFEFGIQDSMKVEAFREGGRPIEEEGIEEDSLARNGVAWQGREIKFLQSNDHPRERNGMWRTEGLEGVAKALVEGDREAGSWLEKLQLVKRVLVDDSEAMRPDEEALAYSHIFISWVNQGILPCVEAGGHRRPNNHAELAQHIFRSLEWVNGPEYRGTRASKVARWLQTKIPSLSAEFRRSEPLTRIRDIAHRNDIPQDLKKEIKHTLQNKLHRNAGPEDLVAAELMCDRIRKDADNLSESFVHEFETFMDELREFFNAGGLSDLLENIAASLEGVDEVGSQNIGHLLATKRKLDSMRRSPDEPGAETAAVMDALHAVTTVRAYLENRLSSGLRNDAPDSALAMRQKYRIAEMRCEEYAFVLLGRFIGLTESQTGKVDLSCAADKGWALPIGAFVLGLRHLGMGGWEERECLAVENEMSAWLKAGRLSSPMNALRVKATLERAQRLIARVRNVVLALFVGRAEKLGAALGADDRAVQVFAESQIRAHTVYQVSNICSILLQAARTASGGGSWDGLVPGTAVGRLIEMEKLDKGEIEESGSGEPLMLLIRQADGYEDISGLRDGNGTVQVAGVVLCQELPHLSHLGVRASQEGLVFASCVDEKLLEEEVRPLVGEQVVLKVDGEGVKIGRWEAGMSPGHHQLAESPTAESKDAGTSARGKVCSEMASDGDGDSNRGEVVKADVMALVDADVGTCGAKAANCGRLEQLSLKTQAFRVPRGLCLPFGIMASVLDQGPLAELHSLLKELESTSNMQHTVGQIKELICGVTLPGPLCTTIGDAFPKGTKVIVRSSSNMEDNAGMTGAGLHESVQNVDASDPDDLSRAVTAVWASLHTERAVETRRAARIPHTDAQMGVVIQQQLNPDISFVLHTTDPVSKDAGVVQAELAPGLGETLASGTRGTPWRMSIDKSAGSVAVKAFANFSMELQPEGVEERGWAPVDDVGSGLVGKTVDYSLIPMSFDESVRTDAGRKLVAAGGLLEEEFGGRAQDVEGAFTKEGDLYIVQARPQPLL
eukprot:evm.model.scf_1052.1 EVM.evm.TU.scf_1052.1   scf_1052:16591-22201(-)